MSASKRNREHGRPATLLGRRRVRRNSPRAFRQDARLWPHCHPYGTGSVRSEPGSGGLMRHTRNRTGALEETARRLPRWPWLGRHGAFSATLVSVRFNHSSGGARCTKRGQREATHRARQSPHRSLAPSLVSGTGSGRSLASFSTSSTSSTADAGISGVAALPARATRTLLCAGLEAPPPARCRRAQNGGVDRGASFSRLSMQQSTRPWGPPSSVRSRARLCTPSTRFHQLDYR
jgi:hypothetical protein